MRRKTGARLPTVRGSGRDALAPVTLTVEDNDGPPTVSLDLSPDSIPENGGVSRVSARLSYPSNRSTTVTVSAAPVAPATAGDFALGANPVLVIPAGDTDSTHTVTITAVDNAVEADDREVTVSAAVQNSQGIIDPDDVVLTIEDDDMARLSVGDASVAEDSADDSTTLEFTVTLAPMASGTVTVDWETARAIGRGAADAGTDHVAGSGSLTFSAGEAEKTVSVTVLGGDQDEADEIFHVVLSNASGAPIRRGRGTGTIRNDDGPSVLAQGSRAGAASLLRRHVQRFSQLTSDLALERLEGARPASAATASGDGEGGTAEGDAAVSLPSGWDGWGSIRYSKVGGSADGSVWDVCAGADRLSEDGRTAWGALVGYEPGRVTEAGVRLEAEHVQVGLYALHRPGGNLTIDGALGWGRGDGELSLAGDTVTASCRSRRLAVRGSLTGDFGWGGGGLRVEPQVDFLHAREDLDAFTGSVGRGAGSERLRMTRVALGPRAVWELEDGSAHGKLRVNLDSHNLNAAGRSRDEVTASLELGRRWQIDDRSSLDLSADFDGLGAGRFSSGSFGLTFDRRF